MPPETIIFTGTFAVAQKIQRCTISCMEMKVGLYDCTPIMAHTRNLRTQKNELKISLSYIVPGCPELYNDAPLKNKN